ncbi:MAG: hypothetical protein LBM01_00280 [Christensenellaceae bacterium]|jgi:hypothetical protein|nr:hypothetical protein [Christensenellaceae bacterium]
MARDAYGALIKKFEKINPNPSPFASDNYHYAASIVDALVGGGGPINSEGLTVNEAERLLIEVPSDLFKILTDNKKSYHKYFEYSLRADAKALLEKLNSASVEPETREGSSRASRIKSSLIRRAENLKNDVQTFFEDKKEAKSAAEAEALAEPKNNFANFDALVRKFEENTSPITSPYDHPYNTPPYEYADPHRHANVIIRILLNVYKSEHVEQLIKESSSDIAEAAIKSCQTYKNGSVGYIPYTIHEGVHPLIKKIKEKEIEQTQEEKAVEPAQAEPQLEPTR